MAEKRPRFDPDKWDWEWKEAKEDASTDARRAHEAAKIDEHKPKFNQRRGGGGRK